MTILPVGKLYKLQVSTILQYLLVINNQKVADIISYGDTFVVLEFVKVTNYGMVLYKVLTKNGITGIVGLWETEVQEII
jgi:hypothetical protein